MAKMKEYDIEADQEFKQEVFEYLNGLRESGVTNMFGATPYIQDVFDMDKRDARTWLKAWMKQF